MLNIRNKIARICWNTNGWIKPSGPTGKAKTKSHEKDFGFGHEEWLLDIGKVFNGYHYGFLEPVRKFQKKYEGQTYNFLLYTIDSNTQQKYWVGWLKNVEVINDHEARSVLNYYKNKGWFDEMRKDLDDIGLNGNRLINKYLREIDIFNVKFKPEEIVNISEKLIPIPKENKLVNYTRYILRDISDEQVVEEQIDSAKDFNFNSGNKGLEKLKSSSRKRVEPREIEIKLKHNIISDNFLEHLKTLYGSDNVNRECDANGGGSVDIVVKTVQGYIFYEIKTYNHLKTSFRVALGQLLEYATFPNKRDAIKLYLVSDLAPSSQIINYVKHLNKIINIPFGYIQFDPDAKKVLNEI